MDLWWPVRVRVIGYNLTRLIIDLDRIKLKPHFAVELEVHMHRLSNAVF